MGRKRKKGRCAKNNSNANIEANELVQAPHTFVIHKGLPGANLLELTKDFRRVMEPFTASSLKERKRNTIKDFVSVAGLLHVSHLVIFSQNENGLYFKTCRLPRGPTLSFKVKNFSLARDIVSCLKKQSVVEAAFRHSPLIILNNFSGENVHMKLMASMFQNMFPSLNLTNLDLNNVRRCVLLNYDSERKTIDFRHYVIKVIPVGISKGVKKVVQGKVPNLNKFSDISEFLTKGGMLSESEVEEDPSHQVTLSQKINTRGNIESGQSSIKLVELGPRLTLHLIKIEDGLLDGEVLYHDFIHKTDEEKLEIQKKRRVKKKLKEERKKRQEKNKEQKQIEKQKLKQKCEEVKDDDAQYYREEVGEDPDDDLFSQNQPRKRKFVGEHRQMKKKKP